MELRDFRRPSLIALGFLACLAFTGNGLFAATREEELTEQIRRIRADGRARHLNPGAMERRFMDLIHDYNAPSERGMIYAAATFPYCSQGCGRGKERETRIAKTIEYASKALENPLDVITSCRLRNYLADALIVKSMSRPEDEQIEARQAATIVCLEGLKLALDNNAPKEKPTAPLFMRYHILTSDKQMLEDLQKKRQEQAVAQAEYRLQRKLWTQRRILSRRFLSFCSGEPNAIEQFRTTATQILVGHEETVDDLVQQIEAHHARAAGKHLQGISSDSEKGED